MTAMAFISDYAGRYYWLEGAATAINAGAENVVKVPKAEAEVVASGEEFAPVVDEIYQFTDGMKRHHRPYRSNRGPRAPSRMTRK